MLDYISKIKQYISDFVEENNKKSEDSFRELELMTYKRIEQAWDEKE
ncbi:hypothetical protein KY330_01430 [Candidatus Woesearchaeota archaeon]|nr:hypothetical protein [Candidatus Woesearchaeota archaeon]